VSMKSMKSIKRVGLAAAGLAATGALVFGAASLASAETTAPSPSASSSSSTGGGRGGSNDAAVTGDELAKVTAAMKAKDSTVTATSVRKDPDGSYDVSADLNTFTLNTGGHGSGK
jgi:hypothetical protein